MFSFGCLIWEILTGASPFQPINTVDVGERLFSMMHLLGVSELPPLFGKIVNKFNSEVVTNDDVFCWPCQPTAATDDARKKIAEIGSIDQVFPYGEESCPSHHFNLLFKQLLQIDPQSRCSAVTALNHSVMTVKMSDR